MNTIETATPTGINLDDLFTGDARHYKLSRPIDGTNYVIVSASNTYSGPETYIFPSNKRGEVVRWLEMTGSFRGGLDHAEALRGAGYRVAA